MRLSGRGWACRLRGLFLLQVVPTPCCCLHAPTRSITREQTPGAEILIILMVTSLWLALDGTVKGHT